MEKNIMGKNDGKTSKELKMELLELIERARKIIKDRKEFHTEGNIEFLEEMIKQGEDAISGEVPPHSGKREFIKLEEEDYLQFAIEHYTMVPEYGPSIRPGRWGLKKAVEWVEQTDIMLCDEKNLERKKEEVLKQGKALLETKQETNTGIGVVEQEQLWELENQLDLLKGLEGELLGKHLVRCLNIVRRLKLSRVFRSDLYTDGLLFMSEAEFNKIREDISLDAISKEQYRRIKEIADEGHLEERLEAYQWNFRKDDYKELDKRYCLWSSTEKNMNFTVPGNTEYVEILFSLPPEDNEAEGLGVVSVKNVELISSSDTMHLRFPEEFELYNADRSHNSKRVITKSLKLKGGSKYNIRFQVKQNGKLKKALEVIISFHNSRENKAGAEYIYYNRKSYIPCKQYNLYMQCDAICYAVTKEKDYALKAKYEILHMMNDFCQGIEYWLHTNERPEGSDAYGAVQGGRNLCSIASAYSLIRSAGVFQKEEKALFYKMTEYFLHYMLDLRDRTELSFEEAQVDTSNWNTDMCIGTIMIMLVLEDYPKRKQWIYNAYMILKGQILYKINKDGSWPESLRYHFSCLERYMTFARVWRFETGEDFFEKGNLRQMLEYPLYLQTPEYEYFKGKISTPPFGDHRLSDGSEFAVYGLYIREMMKNSKAVADLMYITWCRAGRPVKGLWGESMAIENLFYNGKPYRTDKDDLMLQSTDAYANAGIYIFRKNFRTDKECYFAVMSSPKKIGHGHFDQGSFMIYKNCVPIVMDGGIEGYFDATTHWHLSSYSHACLQFETSHRPEEKSSANAINLSAGDYSLLRGWADGPESSRVIECVLSGDRDCISMEIQNPEGKGRHRRSIIFDREGEWYIIHDSIYEFDRQVLFSLPVVSHKTEIRADMIYSTGYYDIDLQTIFLSAIKDLNIEEGRSTPLAGSSKESGTIQYIRAVAEAQEGFIVILYPKKRNEEELTARLEGNKVIVQKREGLEKEYILD